MRILLNSEAYGKNLRIARIRKGLTQREVAKSASITVYTLRWIEKGFLRNIEASVIQQLCASVGEDFETLLHS